PPSVRRGDVAFRYKQYQDAVTAYRIYLDETEHGEYTPRVFYQTALAEYRLKRYRDVLTTLGQLQARYPNGRWVQVDALRGDAERALEHPTAALKAWDAGWVLGSDSDRRKLQRRITEVAGRLNDVELAGARRVVTNRQVIKLLDQQIAARQPAPIAEPIPEAPAERGVEVPNAKASIPPAVLEEPLTEIAPPAKPQEAAGAPIEPPSPASVAAEPGQHGTVEEEPLPEPPSVTATGAEPEELRVAETPGTADVPPARVSAEAEVTAGTGKVGCLLPLSGPRHHVGERALRGIRLVFGADSDRVAIKDTGSDPALAQRMFEEFAADRAVLAVIGPESHDEAVRVAPEAQRASMPLLLLSQDDALSGGYVLQAGLRPSRQIRALLDYAVNKVRLHRFGVVYPDDRRGREFLSAFQTEVERHGGTVVGADAYPLGSAGAAPDVRTVRKWRDAQNLQAVFLPDDATAAARFARFLQDDMPDVTLLGVHGWEGLTAAGGGGEVNGVLFSDGFYAGSQRPAAHEFVARFRYVYGETPGMLEAEAYDAAVLAQRALEGGANSRAALLRLLRTVGPVKGATGALDVKPEGLDRGVFLLQVYDGQLREVTAGPLAGGAEDTLAAFKRSVPAPGARAPVSRGADTVPPEHGEPEGSGVAHAPTGARHEPGAKVACLLPLTGPDRAYGKRSLAGLRLAFADAPEQLVVRDSGGDSARSADLLGRLQHDQTVLAVIGPLRSSEARVAAHLAERVQLPLLLLSPRDGLAGRFALQAGVTRSQQVRQLVRYARMTLEAEQFGITYPHDHYGSAFAKAFEEEVARRGGHVVGTYAYQPGATDFGGAVAKVQGWHLRGLDALFIPDTARTAAALGAQVRREMPGLALLGTESWHDAGALAQAGAAIDGAIFADTFSADSTRPSTRRFVQRFKRRAGYLPTGFEAQAFDAAMAVRHAIAEGATSREQLVARLRSLGRFEGAGELRWVSDGLRRAVSLFRYRNGTVEEVALPSSGT
ncbi:MAG: ABC transporter substrate-binding protein, partial [Candidatus Binatia bacterium]